MFPPSWIQVWMKQISSSLATTSVFALTGKTVLNEGCVCEGWRKCLTASKISFLVGDSTSEWARSLNYDDAAVSVATGGRGNADLNHLAGIFLMCVLFAVVKKKKNW